MPRILRPRTSRNGVLVAMTDAIFAPGQTVQVGDTTTHTIARNLYKFNRTTQLMLIAVVTVDRDSVADVIAFDTVSGLRLIKNVWLRRDVFVVA